MNILLKERVDPLETLPTEHQLLFFKCFSVDLHLCHCLILHAEGTTVFAFCSACELLLDVGE